MKTLNIGRLQLAAQSRKPGYLEAIMSLSKPHPTLKGFVVLSDEDYLAIGQKYELVPGAAAVKNKCRSLSVVNASMGVGDIVGKVATPIARALKMACIDETTSDLKPDSPCAKRKQWLNDNITIPKIKTLITGRKPALPSVKPALQ
jgi:hypothetical protein